MLDIKNKTIGKIFNEAVTLWPNEIFFISPETSNASLTEMSYSEAFKKVADYKRKFIKAGYG